MCDSPLDKPLLEMEAMIGYCGNVTSGLKVHPSKEHLIYPIGSTVVIQNITTKKQEFFTGHTNNVSCLTVSKSGDFIASGQVTHRGFKADIIVWNFKERTQYCKFVLHRNNVEALAFSPNDKYLVSLGGQDDGSVVVWNMETKEAICGSPAQVMSAGRTHTVAYLNQTDLKFVTGGDDTLRVWELNVADRKVRPTEVNVGQIKRVIKCIEIFEDDSFFYCGTTTGDIMKVNTKSHNFQKHGPEKDRFSLGVTALCLLKTGDFLVGAGDGTVCIVNQQFKRTKKQVKVEGAVTSLALRGSGHQFFVGTDKCNIYKFQFQEFSHELITTCHYDVVNDVSFAFGYSGLIATCSLNDIRLWNMRDCKELLRITVPNMRCNAIAIMNDGKTILSGWDDGRVRAFYPESGAEMYVMENSYGGSATALATFSDCTKVISGSNLGHVVVWQVPATLNPKGKPVYVNKHVLLKEHKAKVTCIKIRKNDTECVTSSTDGSCIIWDLETMRRKQMIRVNTLFQYVCYHEPDESQIITTGTDRKIGYWETYDGSMIREVEGSLSGSVNCMDISTNGTYFVSGGDDKLVKLWRYDEGEATHIGMGHSAAIRGVKISPDNSCAVSVSDDGAILKWRFPYVDNQYSY